jgi:putative ABC transport system ATP-binding protein
MTLVCRNLTMAWPRAADHAGPLLNMVNIHFEFGQMTLISGATGSGKSTLLHLLAGLLRPVSGEVRDGDEAISRWPAGYRDQWRRQVGICFQNLHLIQDLSVLDNVLQPMIPRDMAWSTMVGRSRAMVKRLNLAGYMETAVQLLSGGQQQRVAVARSMVHAPRILLLDEPTAFQDDDHCRMLIDLFEQSARGGDCVVVSSHDPRLKNSTRFQARYRLSGGSLEVVT